MGFEFHTSSLKAAVNWARKFSLFQYPFVTACCGMEFMSVAAPKYDIARFGAEFPRFSPRQADLLIIVGTITERQGPALRRIYDQMCEPKWVVAFGVCASTGGFYQNYSTMPGADQVVPVDVYIPGCPPRPEQVLDGLMLLMERIQRGEGHSQITIESERGYDVPLRAIRPTSSNVDDVKIGAAGAGGSHTAAANPTGALKGSPNPPATTPLGQAEPRQRDKPGPGAKS
jgi:NADH-quinone oxidoreductase subunit B